MTNDAKFSICEATSAYADWILRGLADAFAPYRDCYTPAAFVDTVLTRESLNSRTKSYQRNVYRPSGKVTDFFGMRLIEYVKP